MKADHGKLRHFCDDRACPDPVRQLSKSLGRSDFGSGVAIARGATRAPWARPMPRAPRAFGKRESGGRSEIEMGGKTGPPCSCDSVAFCILVELGRSLRPVTPVRTSLGTCCKAEEMLPASYDNMSVDVSASQNPVFWRHEYGCERWSPPPS